jgi:hypothetical protein
VLHNIGLTTKPLQASFHSALPILTEVRCQISWLARWLAVSLSGIDSDPNEPHFDFFPPKSVRCYEPVTCQSGSTARQYVSSIAILHFLPTPTSQPQHQCNQRSD